MRWGDKVEVLEGLAAAGKEVPALDNRPSVLGFEWLWTAFLELSTCRPVGMAVGPIPWTAVQQYVEASQFNDEGSWFLHQVVRHLDTVWLQVQNDQNRKTKSRGPKTKG